MCHSPYALLESTRVVLNADGSHSEAYDYYAYGLMLPGRSVVSHGGTPSFTGKKQNPLTQYHYFIPLRSMSRLRLVWRALLRLWHRAVVVSGSAGGEVPKLVAV